MHGIPLLKGAQNTAAVLHEHRLRVMLENGSRVAAQRHRQGMRLPDAARARLLPAEEAATRASEFNGLSSKVKAIEQKCDLQVSPDAPLVLRLDGCCFRTLTAKMQRPFDGRITRAMLVTAQRLVERTGAVAAFTQSDEISLLLRPAPGGLPWSGRVQKLASIVASMAAAFFNDAMAAGATRPTACFDCRVIAAPDDEAAMEGTARSLTSSNLLAAPLRLQAERDPVDRPRAHAAAGHGRAFSRRGRGAARAGPRGRRRGRRVSRRVHLRRLLQARARGAPGIRPA